MRSVGAGEDAALAEPLDDLGGLLGRGLERRPVAHELHAQEQARAAHVADEGVPLLEPAQARDEMLAHRGRRAPAAPPPPARRARPGPRRTATGLPPKVEKNSMPLSKEAAISGVVTTAASGWPLPMGLPSTTMSGTTPWVSKPQK